jgi:hypothetical protein
MGLPKIKIGSAVAIIEFETASFPFSKIEIVEFEMVLSLIKAHF